MFRIAKWVVVVFVLLLGLALHLKNNQSIELNYYIGVFNMPLSWLVVVMLFVGAVLGVLVCLPTVFRLKQQKRRLEKKIKHTEKEVNNLRVLPVKD